MKKWIVSIMTVLLLAACVAPTQSTSEQQSWTLPQVITQAALPVRGTLDYRVETETRADRVTTEDGVLLAEYSFQLPRILVVKEDGTLLSEPGGVEEEWAAAVAERFNDYFEKWAAAEDFDSLVAAAEEDLAWSVQEGYRWFNGYSLELTTSIYQTEDLVSVCGTYYSYTGGAHPNTWQLGWNYDLTSGNFFGPEGLIADNTGFQEAVVDELIRQAEETAAKNEMAIEDLYWQDYESILRNWSSYAVFFDAGGMHVNFSPYELAPYAFGSQEFVFSYEWMEPYLGEYGRRLLELE